MCPVSSSGAKGELPALGLPLCTASHIEDVSVLLCSMVLPPIPCWLCAALCAHQVFKHTPTSLDPARLQHILRAIPWVGGQWFAVFAHGRPLNNCSGAVHALTFAMRASTSFMGGISAVSATVISR